MADADPRPTPDPQAALHKVEVSLEEVRKGLNAILDGNALASLSQSLQDLQEHTEILRRTVEKEGHKRLFRFIKDLGPALIASFALVISFLHFFFTFFWLTPDIRLVGGSDLRLSYQPETKNLKFGLKLTVANYGRQMDVISRTQAKLLAPDSPTSLPIMFSKSEFVLGASSGNLSLPLALKENSAIDMNITASRTLGTDTLASFSDKTTFGEHGLTRRQFLQVSFTAESTSVPPMNLCFDLSHDVLLGLLEGEEISFTVTECKT